MVSNGDALSDARKMRKSKLILQIETVFLSIVYVDIVCVLACAHKSIQKGHADMDKNSTGKD